MRMQPEPTSKWIKLNTNTLAKAASPIARLMLACHLCFPASKFYQFWWYLCIQIWIIMFAQQWIHNWQSRIKWKIHEMTVWHLLKHVDAIYVYGLQWMQIIKKIKQLEAVKHFLFKKATRATVSFLLLIGIKGNKFLCWIPMVCSIDGAPSCL